MPEIVQRPTRWEPAAEIPESPCYDFVLESAAFGQLKVLLQYSHILGNEKRDLLLNFSDVRAFRSYWDGDGVHEEEERPLCLSGPLKGFAWPLLILASEDFSVSRYLAEATSEQPWQHFRILSLERSLDILARGNVSTEWSPS